MDLPWLELGISYRKADRIVFMLLQLLSLSSCQHWTTVHFRFYNSLNKMSLFSLRRPRKMMILSASSSKLLLCPPPAKDIWHTMLWSCRVISRSCLSEDFYQGTLLLKNACFVLKKPESNDLLKITIRWWERDNKFEANQTLILIRI